MRHPLRAVYSIKETKDRGKVAAASPTDGGMRCPLTSARQYLRGPRFTKEIYFEVTRERQQRELYEEKAM